MRLLILYALLVFVASRLCSLQHAHQGKHVTMQLSENFYYSLHTSWSVNTIEHKNVLKE